MSDTAHKGLLDALLAFQKKAPALQRDAVNPHFKNRYVSLDSITQTITPVLAECGLVWSTMPCRDDTGQPALGYELAHVPSGETRAGVMPLILSKDDMQGLGSAYSYGRRYAISAVLGLSAEDDDGAKASQPRKAFRAPERADERLENGSTARLLKTEEREKVLAAIETAGQQVPLVLAAVGAGSEGVLTVEHARKIKALLDKATA